MPRHTPSRIGYTRLFIWHAEDVHVSRKLINIEDPDRLHRNLNDLYRMDSRLQIKAQCHYIQSTFVYKKCYSYCI